MTSVGSIDRPHLVAAGRHRAEGGDGTGPGDRDHGGDPPGEPGPLGGPGDERAHPRRRRRLLIAAGVLVPAGIAAAVVVTGGDGAPSGAPTPGAGDAATAPVEVRTLSQTEQLDATLDFGEARGVAAGAAGTVTSVAASGTAVDRGDPLFAVDQHPTVLLVGEIPLYRDLAAGVDDGPDVAQLEENLAALGHTDGGAMAVDEHFDSSTAAAVGAWQEARGVEATGEVTSADAVFLPGAGRVADAAVDPGATVQAGATVLDLTGSERVVRAELEPAQADMVQVGDAVSVALPDGAEVAGTVATVAESSAATSADGGAGGSAGSTGSGAAGADAAAEDTTTVEVTVTLADQAPVAAYTTAGVTVEVTGRQREDVLAVPVMALVALAGGGYAVEVPGDAGESELVPVDPGMYADGYVEVTGDGLEEGTDVVVAEL
jgi:peptidoglycan hydrolase-like protein with peptidoglycan-binding domain